MTNDVKHPISTSDFDTEYDVPFDKPNVLDPVPELASGSDNSTDYSAQEEANRQVTELLNAVDSAVEELAKQPFAVISESAGTKKALCVKKEDVANFPFVHFELRDRYGENGCETDESVLQCIPYVSIINNDEMLTYQRGSNSDEKRLVVKRSCGFGGHVESLFEEKFVNDPKNPFADKDYLAKFAVFFAHEAYRELCEELKLTNELDYEKTVKTLAHGLFAGASGWKNITPSAESDEVSKVHFGISMRLYIDDETRDKIVGGNEEFVIENVRFENIATLKNHVIVQAAVKPEAMNCVYEEWSVAVIANI